MRSCACTSFKNRLSCIIWRRALLIGYWAFHPFRG
jgi:hypothetical protein